MRSPLRFFLFTLPVFLFFACDEIELPVVTTNSVTEISTNSAISGGVITDDGGGTIIIKGVCWDLAGEPTIEGSFTNDTVDSMAFTSELRDLAPGTTYYVRAYAKNFAGTGYGSIESFTTLGGLPSATAADASEILPHSATLNGTVSPNLLSTTVIFEYGTSTLYGDTITPSPDNVSGDSSVTISADLTELTPGSEYHYRVKAENSLGIFYSEDRSFITPGNIPEAEISEATDLKLTSATINGSVNPNYLSTTVEFEWGASGSYGNSIIPDQDILTGNDALNITAGLSGLARGTVYHFRIKATNELGTSYSPDMTFKTFDIADADSNYYYTVIIGTQTWFRENLKVTHYRDGSAILLVTDNSAWKNLGTAAYCWYNNQSDYGASYGALYNWYAASSGNLCPEGWRVPSNSDWIILTNFLGGESLAGNKLKESGSTHWGDLNEGSDETGFSALPGGNRDESGSFSEIGTAGYWWTTSVIVPTASNFASMFSNSGSLVRGSNSNVSGYSVRCLKN